VRGKPSSGTRTPKGTGQECRRVIKIGAGKVKGEKDCKSPGSSWSGGAIQERFRGSGDSREDRGGGGSKRLYVSRGEKAELKKRKYRGKAG